MDADSNRFGVPLAQATDPDTEGWWQVELDVDHASIAVATALEAEGDDGRHAVPRVWLDPEYVPRRRPSSDQGE